jgi:hypothetical protein
MGQSFGLNIPRSMRCLLGDVYCNCNCASIDGFNIPRTQPLLEDDAPSVIDAFVACPENTHCLAGPTPDRH